MKKIEITVNPSGETSIKTSGYSGESCKDATKFLESLGKVESDKPTEEMYEQQQGEIEQRGG